MDSTDPLIQFDKNSICNHCQEWKKRDWQRIYAKEHFPKLIEDIKRQGKNKKYDVLIGLSGGADSSTALDYLVSLGLRPFCFSVDNGWNTRESDENIMRLVEGMKVPFYRYVINIPKFKQVQESLLRSGTANVEIPTDHILMAASYEMVVKYDIKYIISGGNHATEGIMPTSWGYQAKDLRFLKGISRTFGISSLKPLPTISLMQYLRNRFLRKIQVINLLDFYEYNRGESIKMLETKYGYKNYGEKHNESIFTWWFQNFYLPTKFNIDKRKAHYSSMINSGQMTRQQAQERLLETLEYPTLVAWDNYARDRNVKSYKDYPNSEWLWNLLGKFYAIIK